MGELRQTWNRYGLVGSVRLLVDLVSTRLSWPQARLVRRPSYVRGKRWIQIGRGFTSGPGLRLDAFPGNESTVPVLRIGTDVQVNDYVHIAAVERVRVGDRVLIASKVFISDHNHGTFTGGAPHDSPAVPPIDRALSVAPVSIADDVWIGEGVAVLPGVNIGRGAVVGAMSVVTRDIPDYCVAAGNPARLLKRYNFETATWEKI